MRRSTMADTSVTATQKPSQADHAVNFEDLLLKYRKVLEKFESNQNQQDENVLNKLTAAAVAARTARIGALQCALQDASSSNMEMGALGQLMEHVQVEMERDATSIEQMKALDAMIPKLNKNVPRLALQPVQVDVDAFFEDYPECIPPDWNQAESESEDKGDSYRKSQDSSRRTKQHDDTSSRQVKVAAQQAHAQDAPQQRPTCAAAQIQRPTTARPNPYATKPKVAAVAAASAPIDLTTQHNAPNQQPAFHHSHQQQNQHRHQPPPRPPPQKYAPPPPTSYQRPMPPLRNNHADSRQTAWDDHCTSNNPFQTAREYARADDGGGGKKNQDQYNNNNYNRGGDAQVSNPYPQQEPPPQQQQPYRPQAPVGGGGGGYNNPYARAGSENPAPEQPLIRESLKRKFVLPKRGSASETTRKNQGGGDSRNRGKSNGSAKGGGVSARQSSNDGDSEDDDLPEELRIFGKELVEKIENEIMDSGDPVTFDDIAGLADAKQTVQEVVCWPMKRPDLFTGLRRAPNGLLLYGPPGTGKTLIGKAIAFESGATFFSISSSSLTSKWIGEGEKLVRVLFAVAAYKEPAVVFIDEIDSLLTQRKADENEASRRIKTEFLVQLDGTGTSGQGRVLVIGATNRPQELDEAARRRFTKRLYIPLPEELDRELLINALLGKNNHRLVDNDIKKLAKETAGFSGADLKSLSTDAAMGPIRQLGSRALEVEVKDVPAISYKHFRQALRGMRPSVAPADLVQYEEWDRTYGSKRADVDMEDDDSEEDDH